jgi:hypothetical protein
MEKNPRGARRYVVNVPLRENFYYIICFHTLMIGCIRNNISIPDEPKLQNMPSLRRDLYGTSSNIFKTEEKHDIIYLIHEFNKNISSTLFSKNDFFRWIIDFENWFYVCSYKKGPSSAKLPIDENNIYIRIPTQNFNIFCKIQDVYYIVKLWNKTSVFKFEKNNNVITQTSITVPKHIAMTWPVDGVNQYMRDGFISAYHCQEGSSIDIYDIIPVNTSLNGGNSIGLKQRVECLERMIKDFKTNLEEQVLSGRYPKRL